MTPFSNLNGAAAPADLFGYEVTMNEYNLRSKSLSISGAAAQLWLRRTAQNTIKDLPVAPKNRLLAELDKKESAALSPFFERVQLRTDDEIYRCDDVVHYIYFPETAVLSEYQILEDGKTVETAMIGREGVSNLTAIFGAGKSSGWTQAAIGGSALRINTKILTGEIQRLTALHAALLKYTNIYLRQISQRVVCHAFHLTENRLCNWLLMLGDRSGSDKLIITQEKIARFLGVHRPSVTTITQSLRERKIIEYRRGKVFIRSRRALENAACPCYAANGEII